MQLLVSSAEPRFYDCLTAEAAAQAGRFTVYGITLTAFNLRHALILESHENECWMGGTVTPEILISAATVCSTEDGNALLPEPEHCCDIIDAHDFNTQADAWEAYIRACNAGPRTKSFADHGKSLKAPVEMVVAVYIMRQLGLSEHRAWTMPRGLAHWYFEAAHEQDTGESMIVDEAEWQEMEAAQTAEAMAKDAANCKRMERLMRLKARKLARCKTERGRKGVETWFLGKLKTFDSDAD